jgi:hypothetical protein
MCTTRNRPGPHLGSPPGHLALALALLAVVAGCGPGDPERAERQDEDAAAAAADPASPQDAFWAKISRPCGDAFPGRLVVDRPDRDLVATDDELIAHWVRCDEDRIHIAFHVGRDGGENWDRSRTWVLTRDADGLELRHDHRHPDGTEESSTWYGATTLDQGSATRQEFVTERNGVRSGWRVEVEPGQRFTYGTIRDGAWRHHLVFDLTAAAPVPPLPWGHETRPSQRPRPGGEAP